MVRKGWTLSSLADAVGVHRSNLSRFFRGETDLRASVFIDMLAVLGISLDHALTEAFNGKDQLSRAVPLVDLWAILDRLDSFGVSGILDRILSSARRLGVKIPEKDLRSLNEYKKELLVVKVKRGGE
jgi:transcriptional regulator with XRE-family HTH domain